MRCSCYPAHKLVIPDASLNRTGPLGFMQSGIARFNCSFYAESDFVDEKKIYWHNEENAGYME